MTLLVSIVAFLIAISVIVSFHELGHFWTARVLGVKVLRYSIGFGRPIWRRLGKDGTEYVIAMIPLGGYVKMLDEREGSVEDRDLGCAFNRQSLSVRSAIVAAGPVFNFILALVLYYLMFILGVSGTRPIVGEVLANSVAEQAGVVAGDRFVAVSGREVGNWQQTLFSLLDVGFREQSFAVTMERDGSVAELVFDVENINLLKNNDLLTQLGIQPQALQWDAVVGKVLVGTAAEQAYLRAGDRVVSIAGEVVGDWPSLVRIVRAHPGQEVTVGIERSGDYLEETVRIATVEREGREVGYLGVLPQPPAAEAVEKHRSFVRYGLLDSAVLAFEKTWQVTVLTFRIIYRLLTASASLDNISGPVGIAEYAGLSLLQGAGAFLGLLAMLSISIGILNLLPIPLLDGGHLLYYLIEAVKGSPVSIQGQLLGQRIGIFLLGCLLIVVLYNDLDRLIN